VTRDVEAWWSRRVGGDAGGEVVSRSDVDCMAGDAAKTTMTKRSDGRSVSDVVHCNAATV